MTTAPGDTPDNAAETLLAAIYVEEAHRVALTRDLLNRAGRNEDLSRRLSDLRRVETNLAALRDRHAHLEARGRDQ